MANFWTSPNRDPKRAYRFLVNLAAFDGGATWYAKSATKPKFSVSNAEHKYINHTFNYPGRVTWDPVTITIVDPVDPNAARQAAELLQASGYYIPGNENAPTTTINKKDAVAALKRVEITQIGESNTDVLERWVLNNAWVESVNFSDLDYESDELSTIELTLRFDWAELETKDADGTLSRYFTTNNSPSNPTG
jgi:hypothetical protein